MNNEQKIDSKLKTNERKALLASRNIKKIKENIVSGELKLKYVRAILPELFLSDRKSFEDLTDFFKMHFKDFKNHTHSELFDIVMQNDIYNYYTLKDYGFTPDREDFLSNVLKSLNFQLKRGEDVNKYQSIIDDVLKEYKDFPKKVLSNLEHYVYTSDSKRIHFSYIENLYNLYAPQNPVKIKIKRADRLMNSLHREGGFLPNADMSSHKFYAELRNILVDIRETFRSDFKSSEKTITRYPWIGPLLKEVDTILLSNKLEKNLENNLEKTVSKNKI